MITFCNDHLVFNSLQRVLLLIVCCFLFTFITQPIQAATYRHDFDFSISDHGWTAGFSDYPVGQEEDFSFIADHRPTPVNLGGSPSLYLSGNNQNDDLFMYYKKKITGLQPNTNYELHFDLQLASNAPFGSDGVGGSPAHDVFLKAGAVNYEPNNFIDQDDQYRLNVDKGNHSQGGSDVFVMGDIAKPIPDTSFSYRFISRDTDQIPIDVNSDNQGSLWLLFGTDSDFAGTTSLYYSFLTVSIEGEAIPGDANEDGRINKADFKILLNNYGKANSATFNMGDFDGDQKVGLNDLLIIKNQSLFPPSSVSSSSSLSSSVLSNSVIVPEPSGLTLLISVFAFAIFYRQPHIVAILQNLTSKYPRY